jgi:hypothetical protein
MVDERVNSRGKLFGLIMALLVTLSLIFDPLSILSAKVNAIL